MINLMVKFKIRFRASFAKIVHPYFQSEVTHIVAMCDPTPANEALCGKINFELWAKMQSKVKISQKWKYA